MSVKTYTVRGGLALTELRRSENFAIVATPYSDEIDRAESLLQAGYQVLYPMPELAGAVSEGGMVYMTRRK